MRLKRLFACYDNLEALFRRYQDAGLLFGLSFGTTATMVFAEPAIRGICRLPFARWWIGVPLYLVLSALALATLWIRQLHPMAPMRPMWVRVLVSLTEMIFIWSGFYVTTVIEL